MPASTAEAVARSRNAIRFARVWNVSEAADYSKKPVHHWSLVVSIFRRVYNRVIWKLDDEGIGSTANISFGCASQA